MKLLRESLASRIQTMRQFPTYTNQPPTTLYHNTKLANVESILANGILLAKARFPEYEGKGIWATTNEPGKGYGGRTVAFNSEGYDLENVGGGDYRVWQDIKPEDILFVDFFVTSNNRLSELPKLIQRLGIDKVMQVVKSVCDKGVTDVPYEVIEDLVKR